MTEAKATELAQLLKIRKPKPRMQKEGANKIVIVIYHYSTSTWRKTIMVERL